MHLFDQKSRKQKRNIVKYYYKLKYLFSSGIYCKRELIHVIKVSESLQSHDLQKSFYVDFLLKNHFWLLSMLKTAVLPNILVYTGIYISAFFNE